MNLKLKSIVNIVYSSSNQNVEQIFVIIMF